MRFVIKTKLLALLLCELMVFQSVLLAGEPDARKVENCVPEKYGTIKQIHIESSSDKWVIHIQDAHCNLDAQKNISNILSRLLRKECLDTVLIEGSTGKINPAPLASYPDKKSRNSVSGYLLKNADISGAEYFSIVKDNKVPIFGVEDGKVYLDNLSAMQNLIGLKKQNNELIDRLEQFIADNKDLVWSDEVLGVVVLKDKYRSHEVELGEYLSSIIGKTNFKEQTYPNLFKMLSVYNLNKSIEFSMIDEETSGLLNLLSKTLDRENLSKLFQVNLSFKIGDISSDQFYAYLLRLIRKEGVDTSRFKNVLLYSELISGYGAVNSGEIRSEIMELERSYMSCLGDKEKALFEFGSRCSMLRDFFNLSMSNSDKDYLLNNIDDFSSKSLLKLIEIVSSDEVSEYSDLTVTIDFNRKQIMRFYELAGKRDEILVGNTLERMESSNTKWGVLVAGGFHTKGITEALIRNNVNFAVVIPKIKSVTNTDMYWSRMKRSKQPLESFIESAINSLADSSWLAQNVDIVDSTRKQVKLTKAISLFLAESVDNISLDKGLDQKELVLKELSSIIEGYDTKQVSVVDFKRIYGYRFYKLDISGNEMVYYFEDKNSDTENSDNLRDFVLSDVHNILDKEISLGHEKSVIAFKEEILGMMAERFELWESSVEGLDDTLIADSDKISEIVKIAVLDHLFVSGESSLNAMLESLRTKHGLDIDFRTDVQPVIEGLVDIGAVDGVYDEDGGVFSLSDHARMSYYMMTKADKNNYFPNLDQFLGYYQKPFLDRDISSVFIEGKTPFDAMFALVRDLELDSMNGKSNREFEYVASDGEVYLGDIIEHDGGFKYFRITSKFSAGEFSESPESFLEVADFVNASELVDITPDDRVVLTLSVEKDEYIVSVLEMSDDSRPETVLFQESVVKGEQTSADLLEVLVHLKDALSGYIHLQGINVITGDRVKYIGIEDLTELELQDILPDVQFSGLLANEINNMNNMAYSDGGEALESIVPVADEYLDEKRIVEELVSYEVSALIEVAKSTRNFAYMRVLAGSDLYSHSGSKIREDSLHDYAIKCSLIENALTPTDLLLDFSKDISFFKYLVSERPDVIQALINHPNAIYDLINSVADKVDQFASKTLTIISDELKKGIIESDLVDETILMRYTQDPSAVVRVAVAKSRISDFMVGNLENENRLVIIEIAKNKYTSLTSLYSFTEQGVDKEVKKALASNAIIDKKIVDRLIETKDEGINVELAKNLANNKLVMFQSNPEQIDAYLMDLVRIYGEKVDAEVAGSSNKISKELQELLFSQGVSIQEVLADRKDLDTSIVLRLYNTGSDDIVRRLVLNPAVELPSDMYSDIIVESLNKEDGWRIRLAVAAKKNLSEVEINELAEDPNLQVRARIALRTDLEEKGEDLFEQLANDKFAYVRANIAMNSTTPSSILKKFRDDNTNLAEGLLGEDGYPIDGIDKAVVKSFLANDITVLTKLTQNERIIRVPELIDPLLRDRRYHGYVTKMVQKRYTRALRQYQIGNYPDAKETLSSLVTSKYPPFGAMFYMGNLFYISQDYERAINFYKRSSTWKNNIASKIALHYMENGKAIPQCLLSIDESVFTIIQNLHHAQSITDEDIPAVISFIESLSEFVPLSSGDSRVPVSYVELLNDEKTEHLVALQLYVLRDVMSNGFLSMGDALDLIKDLFVKIPEMKNDFNQWPKTYKTEFWKEIINRTNLHDDVKADLKESSLDQVEFFLRGGVRGIAKYNEYQDFRNKIIMDNVSPSLREDFAISVWMEFLSLTEDLLFSEPEAYFKRISLMQSGSSISLFSGVDRSFRISLSLKGGEYGYGIGDINSEVRSEGAHSIASGIFKNLGLNPVVDEFQDRASVIRFPKLFDDPDQKDESDRIVNVYRRHDSLAEELSQIILEKNSIGKLIKKLERYKGKNIIEDFVIRNTLSLLQDDQKDPLSHRIIGEALYYLYRREQSTIGMIDKRLPEIIGELTELKETITEFPWDVRIFFDGGCYYKTYRQSFPVLAPPLDVVSGAKAVDRFAENKDEQHYVGEWLHYMLKLKMRKLLQDGEVDYQNLHRFYRTTVMYMGAVVRNGEFFKRMDNIQTNFNSGNASKAMVELLNVTNEYQVRGLPEHLVKQIKQIRKNTRSKGAFSFDESKLSALLLKKTVDKYVDSQHEAYPKITGYLSSLRTYMEEKKYTMVGVLSAHLVDILDEHGFYDYARSVEALIIPDPAVVDFLNRSVGTLLSENSDLRIASATSIREIVNFIRELTPDQVFAPIEKREVIEAEPEKVVLKEIGNQISNGLFLSGEVKFAKFVNLMTNYYSTVYSSLKDQQISIDTQGYIQKNESYWDNIKGTLVPFLSTQGVVMTGFLEKIKEKMKKQVETKNRGTKMYTHWSSLAMTGFMFDGMGVVSLKAILTVLSGLGGIVLAGIVFGWVLKYFLNRIPSPVKSIDDKTDDSAVTSLPPFSNLLIKPSQKIILIDIDSLNNIGVFTSLEYLLSKKINSDIKIVINGSDFTREQIKGKLQKIAMRKANEKLLKIISKEDADAVDVFDIKYYLRNNLGINPNQVVLFSSAESALASDLLPEGAIAFTDEDNFIGLISFFAGLLGTSENENFQLPENISISNVAEDSSYYGWFVSLQKSNGVVYLSDLVEHVTAGNKSLNIGDLTGFGFGKIQRFWDPVSLRKNIKDTSDLIESSM